MVEPRNNQPQSHEQQFRSSLEDVAGVCEKMAGYCNSIEELVEVVRLALQNDAQLKIIANIVFDKTRRT